MIYLRNLLANMGLRQEDYTEVFEDKTACTEWSMHVLELERAQRHVLPDRT
jgi:hypothetical protein